MRFFAAFSLVLFSLSCQRGCNREPAPKEGDAIRITQGEWNEESVRLNPEGTKALVVRLGKKDKDGSRLEELESSVFEIDLSDPNYPTEKEITELKGGHFPSYAGKRGIVALDKRGRPVLLKNRWQDLEELIIEGIPALPAKPIASPDGKYLAFLSLDLPNSANSSKLGSATLENQRAFRHQAYIVLLPGGEARKVSNAVDKDAVLSSLDWADGETVRMYYQITGRQERHTRIEKVNIKNGLRRLALFADFTGELALSKDETFFVTLGETPNKLSFFNKGLSKKEQVDLGQILSVLNLAANKRFVIVGRFCPDVEGVNLFWVPIPDLGF